MIKESVSKFTNTELVDMIKDLKKNENNFTNLLEFSKNFRYLLSHVRDIKEMHLQDFIGHLDYEIKCELVNRISKNKIIVY